MSHDNGSNPKKRKEPDSIYHQEAPAVKRAKVDESHGEFYHVPSHPVPAPAPMNGYDPYPPHGGYPDHGFGGHYPPPDPNAYQGYQGYPSYGYDAGPAPDPYGYNYASGYGGGGGYGGAAAAASGYGQYGAPAVEAMVAPSPPAGGPVLVGGKTKAGVIRHAAGQTWYDANLTDWPDNDWRIFVGDLGNDISEEQLLKAFSKYKSCTKSRIVRDKRGKARGYGFLSFGDPHEFVAALREMNGKYIGNRPVKLRKSTWKDRSLVEQIKEKEKVKHDKQVKIAAKKK